MKLNNEATCALEMLILASNAKYVTKKQILSKKEVKSLCRACEKNYAIEPQLHLVVAKFCGKIVVPEVLDKFPKNYESKMVSLVEQIESVPSDWKRNVTNYVSTHWLDTYKNGGTLKRRQKNNRNGFFYKKI